MIKLNLKSFDKKENVEKILKSYESKIKKNALKIEQKKCKGSDMLGWLTYPSDYDKNEIDKIIKIGSQWNKNIEIKNIVLLAIGGSYIATKAAIDMNIPFFNRDKEIFYVSNMSSTYIVSLLEKLKKEDFYLIVVSKSGTTLETAIAFKIFFELLYTKNGSEVAKDRIAIITDKENGSLRQIATKYNLVSFSVPNDIGGRFSAISPVGLLPMAVMGLDIKKILKGCQKALNDCKSDNIQKNDAYKYAALRHYMYSKKQKAVEFFITYEPNLFFVTEHLKQLFGESEGKDKKGLYPSNCLFTTDLHSIGQFLQDGTQMFFETCLLVKEPKLDMTIGNFLEADDGLKFINDKSIDQINKIAASSTIDAHHIDGGVPIVQIEISKMDEENFGYLYSWFSKALAMSALLLDVNPFDQPGVEAYKKRMFSKLKK
ncbi:MAG: glucose-6-phosphate isomerase [Malacoplasma sp.]